MNGLLPIVRRVRRPLLPPEDLSGTQRKDAHPPVVPVKPAAEAIARDCKPQHKHDDGKNVQDGPHR
jgi:hypothetical protein